MDRFIDEAIVVEVSGDLPRPVSFRWRGEDYAIEEVLQQWSDWHFGAGSHKRTWRNRRHRNYYRVRTLRGLYELYFDRGVPEPEGRWILYQELLSAPTGDNPG